MKTSNQTPPVGQSDYFVAVQPQLQAASSRQNAAPDQRAGAETLLNNIPPKSRVDSKTSGVFPPARNAFVAKRADATSSDPSGKDKVPVQTNVRNLEELREVLDEFKLNGKRTAVISGGSLCGMATAIQLSVLGFNVLVAEKRPFYCRHNVLAKREEAIYSLASLSEDGTLLRYLIDNKYISINEANLTQSGENFKKEVYSAHRFMGWMVPHEKMKPVIPGRSRKYAKEQAQYLNIERARLPKTKEPAEHLDLAWPDHEVVTPVAPNDWRYEDLTRMGPDNLATAKVLLLEQGLNEYCIARGIKFVQAETDLYKQAENETYGATLSFQGRATKGQVTPDFPLDLICLAESASGKNARLISLQTTIPTNESVYITNFSGKPTDAIAGFTGRVFDAEDTTIVLHASTDTETVVNIGTRGKPGEDIAPDALRKKLDKAKPMMSATGSDIGIEPTEVTYESGRLDIALTRAMNPIHGNVVILGDGAASGSPIGALGGSLALSAYPEMVKRLVTDARFGSEQAAEQLALAKEFRVGISQIGNVRHGLMSDLMTKLRFYSKETQKQQLLQGASSLFLMHDENRKGTIMDPRQPGRVWLAHPAGEAWFRQEFAKLEAEAHDEAGKPPRHVLEYMISGNYPPIAERTTREAHWEQILLRHVGDVERAAERRASSEADELPRFRAQS